MKSLAKRLIEKLDNISINESFTDDLYGQLEKILTVKDVAKRKELVKKYLNKQFKSLKEKEVMSRDDLMNLGKNKLLDRLYNIVYEDSLKEGSVLKANLRDEYSNYYDDVSVRVKYGWVNIGEIYNIIGNAMSINLLLEPGYKSTYDHLKSLLERSELLELFVFLK